MSYDNWKTIDRDYEEECKAREKLEEQIVCDICGNDDLDEFENIEVDSYSSGGYDCTSITATCKICNADFNYGNEPDFDSMREEKLAKAQGWF